MSPASLLLIQSFISKCHIEVKKHAFPAKYQTGDAEINAMRRYRYLKTNPEQPL
jgi:hypothetical protein